MGGLDSSPRVGGGRPILYVGLATSHTVGDFCCTQGKHWYIGCLAQAGGQQHRGHGGSAIGIDGLVDAKKMRSEGRLCHNCHASGFGTLGDLIAPAIACRRSGIKWFASAVSLVRYVRIVVCLRTAAWIGLRDTQDLTGLPLDREVLGEKAQRWPHGENGRLRANHEINIRQTICMYT